MAVEFGYILSRHTAQPGAHPVMHFQYKWVLLGCDGTLTLTEETT
jgi:hypothetical protein